jgi:hypothetical protein
VMVQRLLRKYVECRSRLLYNSAQDLSGNPAWSRNRVQGSIRD